MENYKVRWSQQNRSQCQYIRHTYLVNPINISGLALNLHANILTYPNEQIRTAGVAFGCRFNVSRRPDVTMGQQGSRILISDNAWTILRRTSSGQA